MSSAPQTRFGVYQSHTYKGPRGELLVTIAFPHDIGQALVDDLGPSPARYKKIAVAVGAVAETLDELLGAERADAADVQAYDPGSAVAEIARLVVEVDRLTARMGSTLFHADREPLKEQQLTAARQLAAAQIALTEYFRAGAPGARAA